MPETVTVNLSDQTATHVLHCQQVTLVQKTPDGDHASIRSRPSCQLCQCMDVRTSARAVVSVAANNNKTDNDNNNNIAITSSKLCVSITSSK